MTRALLDACVLFPSVMREMLMGVAETGLIQPLWSERILEEWHRAAIRHGAEAEMIAAGEIALLKARWPQAAVETEDIATRDLNLPDPDDVHVLAAAIKGGADELVTANLRDFPTPVLSSHGIIRRDPDGFLLELAHAQPDTLQRLAKQITENSSAISGEPQDMRTMLRKTGLPRLGKFLAGMPVT